MNANDLLNPHGYLANMDDPVSNMGQGKGMKMRDIINTDGYLSNFDNASVVFGRRHDNGFHHALDPAGSFSFMDEPVEIIGEGKVLHKLVAKTPDLTCHVCEQYSHSACHATHGQSYGALECDGGNKAIPGIT